jgi:PKD repeat protein
LLSAAVAQATTIVLPSDDQLIAKSPVIVEGTVLSTTPADRDGRIVTETVVQVARTIKGNVPQTITVSELGGELNGRLTKLFGAPAFAEGEHVLLFLEAAPQGGYRTMDLYVGKFRDERTIDGRRLWYRDDTTADVTLLDANFRKLDAQNIQRDAVGFETYIVDRGAGRGGIKTYGIENPVLERKGRGDRFGGVETDFTLIDEPTVYRWTMFDSGTTAPWYHQGTQPGYTGGGVNEIRTAMGAWTGYTAAKILYSYTGAFTGTPGGLNRSNGRNEVLLNDPLNEISGTWNPSTGGVVGTGGFTGVSGSSNWTATFGADATHTAGLKRVFNIVEGNLTVQDGVSPSTGLSSNRLSEIISHEFGHTLGFGHSTDPTALMYPSVTGLGPQLRPDDQLSARWLYPSGTGGGDPTPVPAQKPAAPSNLQVSVVNSSAALFWNDNATDETSQKIFLSAGTAAFTKVADAAANDGDATLTGLAAGSYRVYVVATNNAGDSAPSNTVNFSIASLIKANFSISSQSGTAGLTTFTFYDETTGGTVNSRLWTFGDGTSSTAAVVNHIYAQPGQYSVTLSVNGGQSQATKIVTVLVPLTAGFTWSPANPSVDDTISFQDTSAGAVTSWFWTFGDGTSSTSQNPSKKYSLPGMYAVTLTITSNLAQTVLTKSVIVTASSPITPSVSAAFDAPTTALAGTPVNFLDRSTGAATSWSWNFGDGGTSALQNPSHPFVAPGSYTVSLRAANAISTSLVTRTILVTNDAAPFRSLVSAVAATSGAGGTNWRTELSLLNAGTQGASITFFFLPQSSGEVLTRQLFLSPKQSITYANALTEIFGLNDRGGALAIEATSATGTPALKVTSRTFTGGAPLGTYGQSVPDVVPGSASEPLYITGVQKHTGYRTNIGVVNRSDAPVDVTMTLFDSAGGAFANASFSMAARTFQQLAVGDWFAAVGARTFSDASMRVTSSAGNALSVYASVVDNITQDPVYIQAVPAPQGSSVTLAAVGRAPGANGTFWRSDATFFNPTSTRMTLSLRYLPTGSDNRNAPTTAVSLNSGATVMLADLLSQFGLTSGSGAMEVSWSGGTGPIVTSRTYTTAETGGTFGQSIDPIAAFGTEFWIPGLHADGNFRSNVGFVNDGTAALPVTIRLLSTLGTELATRTITVEPKSQMQYAVNALFPNVPATFTIHAQASSNLFAYGSMVDNASGDPVYFAGR